ncbi:hematopoietic prostaglandin D synthase isoform X5 [Oncorhynchus nerka]|uniref:hematopoietic prostaglandin D synthase isoform X5 n=1 Tax=Oncorhynchus nerka TaxID=8023 RepID=UPI0031B83ADF
MTSYKLTYFNMRGRAELPRYIFAYAGIAFEDRRVEWSDWPSIKKKVLMTNNTLSAFPLGKLPVLEVNGLPLTQSLAIARFLAKEAGLVGNSRLAEAQADALVDTLNDFTLLIPWREDNPQIKTQKIDMLFQSHAPKLLDHLQCHLGDRKWLVGDSVTMVDRGRTMIPTTTLLLKLPVCYSNSISMTE